MKSLLTTLRRFFPFLFSASQRDRSNGNCVGMECASTIECYTSVTVFTTHSIQLLSCFFKICILGLIIQPAIICTIGIRVRTIRSTGPRVRALTAGLFFYLLNTKWNRHHYSQCERSHCYVLAASSFNNSSHVVSTERYYVYTIRGVPK